MLGKKDRRDLVIIPIDATKEERLELMIKQWKMDSREKLSKLQRRENWVNEKDYKRKVNQNNNNKDRKVR